MASIYCHELQMFHCNPMPKNIQLMQVSIFSYSKDQCHNIEKYGTIVKKICKYYRQGNGNRVFFLNKHYTKYCDKK